MEALSIDVDGKYGVVCLGSQGMFCTSCRHSTSCTHISFLKNYIESCSQDQVDPGPELQKFIDFEVPSYKQKAPSIKKSPTALSGKLISFSPSPFSRECFKKDHTERFNMANGIAYLIPAATPACLQCGAQNLWSAPCMDESTFLVTPLCCYKAEGTASIMYCVIHYVRFLF